MSGFSKSSSQSWCRRTGFLIADAIFALALAVTLLMLISVIIVRQRAVEGQLAAIRTATRDTEAALLSAQLGLPLPSDVECGVLGDPAPAGYHWVRISLHKASSGLSLGHGGKSSSLVGLVPIKNRGPDR